MKAFGLLEGQLSLDDTFMNSWPKQLMGQQANAALQGANAGLQASPQKMYNQQMQDLQQAQQAQQQAASQQTAMINGQAMPMSNDPTSVAIRRCVELEGSTGSCMGGGLIGGMISLATGGEGLSSLAGRGARECAERRLLPQSKWGFRYPEQDRRGIEGHVAGFTQPRDIDHAFGRFSPRTRGDHAQWPNRHRLHIVTTTRTGNCAPNCVTSTQTPIYAPATDHCSVGALKAPPPPPPPSANGSGASPLGGGPLGGVMDSPKRPHATMGSAAFSSNSSVALRQ